MKTSAWIAIIVSVVIAAIGISFGAIQGGAKQVANDLHQRVDNHEVYIQELKEQSAVTVNELEHINEKLDTLLNGG
jgi:flagellar basal body-associated protein FliL